MAVWTATLANRVSDFCFPSPLHLPVPSPPPVCVFDYLFIYLFAFEHYSLYSPVREHCVIPRRSEDGLEINRRRTGYYCYCYLILFFCMFCPNALRVYPVKRSTRVYHRIPRACVRARTMETDFIFPLARRSPCRKTIRGRRKILKSLFECTIKISGAEHNN